MCYSSLITNQWTKKELRWAVLIGAEEKVLAKVGELGLAQAAVTVGVHGLEDILGKRLVVDAHGGKVVGELVGGHTVVLVGVNGIEDDRQCGVDGGPLCLVTHGLSFCKNSQFMNRFSVDWLPSKGEIGFTRDISLFIKY